MSTQRVVMDEQMRGILLDQVPDYIQKHMKRVYRWAKSSFEPRDKIAVDELFTYIAWLQSESDVWPHASWRHTMIETITQTATNQRNEKLRGLAADLTEAWASKFPANRFSGTTAETALMLVGPQEVVDLVFSALTRSDSED